jgi:hypothetical protein
MGKRNWGKKRQEPKGSIQMPYHIPKVGKKDLQKQRTNGNGEKVITLAVDSVMCID